MAKRYLAIPAVFVLLWQLILPGAAWAGGPSQMVNSQVPAALVGGNQTNGGQPLQNPVISLEKAINIVKDNFDIPQEYTRFTSGINMNNQSQSWSLNWSSPDQPGGNFSAQVDANTGEIMNINNWKNIKQPGPTVQIPQIPASEAEDIAVKLVTRLADSKLAELQLMPMDNTIIPLTSYGPVSYTVQWQRLVNGIPFPNNGVTVQVNALSGEIQSYSMNWTPLTQIPEAKGVIAASKAEAVFMDSPMLELQYFTPSLIRPLTAGEKADVKLVYQLNSAYPSGAIDALTGDPIKVNTGGYYGYKGGYGGMPNAGSVPAQPAQSQPLTPAEQTEIDQNAHLLTQDEAVAAVQRWVTIPDNLVLRGASLSTDGISGDSRVWNLNWSGNKPDDQPDDQPQYMNARVDAVTGELLGFNLPYPPQSDKSVLDRNQAQTIAEDFLKQLQPNHFPEVKLADDNYPLGKGVPTNGPQGFNYYRIVNGLPYRANGINITVDTVSREIINYNLNWANLDFPPVSGILDSQQASIAFLQAEPLKLIYTQIFNPEQPASPGELRLVYQPTPVSGTPVSNIMDAQTGDFLDWQGQPASQTPRAYHFTDIGDSFAQQEIALLGQAGIFGEYQDQFHPDEQITAGSLIKALLAVTNGYGVPAPQNGQDMIKTAEQQGWLTEDVQPSATITREDFTKLMIRFLKLEPVAKLQGIYQAPYPDVNTDFAGYAALAKGIGMFNIDGETFEPEHIMTRAEAAYAIVKALMFQP